MRQEKRDQRKGTRERRPKKGYKRKETRERRQEKEDRRQETPGLVRLVFLVIHGEVKCAIKWLHPPYKRIVHFRKVIFLCFRNILNNYL